MIYLPVGHEYSPISKYQSGKKLDYQFSIGAQRREWLNNRPKLHALYYYYYPDHGIPSGKEISGIHNNSLNEYFQDEYGMPVFYQLQAWLITEKLPISEFESCYTS